MRDMPGYDAWLESPYMDQIWPDDVPDYQDYLENWQEAKYAEYEVYHVEVRQDGENVLTFENYLLLTNSKPLTLEEFMKDYNEAAHEQSLYMRGYDF